MSLDKISDLSPHPFSIDAQRSENARVRVLIAENTRMASELLASALQNEAHINVLAAVGTTSELGDMIAEFRPQVVLLSSSLKGHQGNGLELARQLQVARPEIRIVMLVEGSSPNAVVDAFRAGASGVFSRETSMHSLSKCIHAVYDGQVWANNEQIKCVLEALAGPTKVGVNEDKLSSLTKREREVVNLASEGLTNKEVANKLEISEHTVKNYMFSIFEKLEVKSRVELSVGPALAAKVFSLKDGNSRNEEAFRWLRDLAEEGLASAQFLLGEIYHRGRRVPPDRVEAYHWYLLAQQCDMSLAGDSARKKLAKDMSPSEVAEAERRALNWLQRKKRIARRA
jgi:two-component system, NarL family, nitrate/nitrite response regulator NarL